MGAAETKQAWPRPAGWSHPRLPTRRSSSWRGLLLLALLGAGPACLEPGQRASLTVELLLPADPRPRCVSGDPGLGRLNPRGEPLPGGRVSLSPGGFSGRSGTDGKVLFSDLPAGDYTLDASASGQLAVQPQILSLTEGEQQVRTLMLSPCVHAGQNRARVGFGASVSLKAENRCGSAWSQATYQWTQVAGPDITASASGFTASVFSFTTRALDDKRALPDGARKLGFSPDEAGQYVFQLTARLLDGSISRSRVMVTATDVTGGLSSVAPGERHYFLGPKTGPYAWVIDAWPKGWIRTLEGETTRTPTVLPLPPEELGIQGTLTIREVHSNTAFNLVVGAWNQVNRDCGRSDCHPAIQARWERTRHASTWRRLLDGELTSSRGEAAAACAACHALGHDPSVDNGGYDDVARRLGQSFPRTLASGTYQALPSSLKEVSQVYCLACHGPARVDPPVAEQPGRFAASVCGRCHDRLPEQDRVAQWKQSRMSRTVKDDLDGPEARKECTYCHTAQGVYYKRFALARPPSSKVSVLTCCEALEPITCQACHSPMHALDEAQLHLAGSVRTDSGLELTSVGSGALCAVCHNTGHAPSASETVTLRLAPHSPQTDLAYGHAGFSLTASGLPALSGTACAKAAGEGCVTCHMEAGPAYGDGDHRQVGGHTFRMTSAGGRPNLRPCQACHTTMTSFDPKARGDFDGDSRVESVRDEVDGLLALLKNKLQSSIKALNLQSCSIPKTQGIWIRSGFRNRLVIVDEQGVDLGDCDRNGRIERQEQPWVFADADLTLHRAAYNYLLVVADGSRGLHNLPYTVRLLQRTVVAVTGGKDLPAWEHYP